MVGSPGIDGLDVVDPHSGYTVFFPYHLLILH